MLFRSHVGGHNEGNIGFSLIGNYMVQQHPPEQLEALARGLRWAARSRPSRSTRLADKLQKLRAEGLVRCIDMVNYG